jgi:hypothetical protein
MRYWCLSSLLLGVQTPRARYLRLFSSPSRTQAPKRQRPGRPAAGRAPHQLTGRLRASLPLPPPASRRRLAGQAGAHLQAAAAPAARRARQREAGRPRRPFCQTGARVRGGVRRDNTPNLTEMHGTKPQITQTALKPPSKTTPPKSANKQRPPNHPKPLQNRSKTAPKPLQNRPQTAPKPPKTAPQTRGVLFLDVRGAESLPAGDWLTGDTSAYAAAALAGQARRTGVVPGTKSPRWGATFEFFNARLGDTLVVVVSRFWGFTVTTWGVTSCLGGWGVDY